MTEYKKSLCFCYDCNKKKDIMQNEIEKDSGEKIPTNLSLYLNDKKSIEYLDCNYENTFRNNIEPMYIGKTEYKYLNPQAITQKYGDDFIKNSCRIEGCNSEIYESTDPRLLDVRRGERLGLNTPPLDSNLKLDTIYTDKNLDNYSKKYNTYKDINTGDVMYYIDESIKSPFFEPNFVSSSHVESKIYKDPMGSLKPIYERYPIISNNPLTSNNSNYKFNLSWMQDTTSYREDIMSKQMSRRNEQRWEPRWEI